MQSTVDCVPCYIEQVICTLRRTGLEENDYYPLINDLYHTIARLDPAKTPAENTSLVLFEAYRLLGQEDPFQEAKIASNRLARTFLPALERIIAFTEDPLLTALETSVAGNVIDMGIDPCFDVGERICQEVRRGFQRNDIEPLRDLLNEGGTLVILADNCGEIFFDYMLMANLCSYTDKMYYVVKDGPILNNATLDDVKDTGIHLLADIISTGNNYLGVVPEHSSQGFRSVMESADIVLAKGQANYTSLEGTAFAGEKTFFLLHPRCPKVANSLGADMGNSVLVRNKAY